MTIEPQGKTQPLGDDACPPTDIDASIDIAHAAALRIADVSKSLLFDRLFDSNIVGLFIADLDGSICSANVRFLQIFGYDVDDLPLRWDQMTPEEHAEKDLEKIKEVLETGAGEPWQKEYFHRDGHRVPVLLGVARLSENVGTCVCFAIDLSGIKEAEQQLGQQRKALQAMAAEVALAEHRERHRIAAGLHADVGQRLALVALRLSALEHSALPRAVSETLADISKDLKAAVDCTRTLTFELGAAKLLEFGLGAALKSLGERLTAHHDLRYCFDDPDHTDTFNEDVNLTLYSAVRELLTNVIKHARASEVRVSLKKLGDRVRVVVEDDGVGFAQVPRQASGAIQMRRSYGLFSIRERIEYVGGDFELTTGQSGTRVVMFAPVSSGA